MTWKARNDLEGTQSGTADGFCRCSDQMMAVGREQSGADLRGVLLALYEHPSSGSFFLDSGSLTGSQRDLFTSSDGYPNMIWKKVLNPGPL